MRDKARQTTRIIGRPGLAEQGEARPCQGIGVTIGGVEQQRDPRIKGNVAAVLRKIRQQK